MSTPKNGKATIYDVAEMANTSATTVSRVLNNKDYPVSDELKNRVLEAVSALEYKPNIVARSLKTSKSRDIGVIIPTISNQFYSGVILAIEKHVSKYNYNLILCNTLRDSNKERQQLQLLYEKQITGVILSSVSNDNIEEYRKYIDNNMQLVLLDQKIPELDCSNFQVDMFYGVELAIKHLVDLGHEKIGFVSSPLTRYSRMEMYEGYCYALGKYGIEFSPKNVLIADIPESKLTDGSYEYLVGEATARRYVDDKLDITAVITVNDMVALGFIQKARELGVLIPDDLSVVGCDDISFAKLFTPSLTTIKYPTEQIAKRIGSHIIDRITNNQCKTLSVSLLPTLVQRDSTKAIK